MQTKRKNVMRFIALLGLFALVVSCTACAIAYASNIDESADSVDSVDSVTLDGSDGTESDKVSGEISVAQSAEELMVPVGTKTTVEKVTSYPIGEGEAFQYAFEYCELFDSEKAYFPTIPYYAQIDENEDLYLGYWWDTVTRLRDGKQWKSTYSWKTSYPESAYYRFVIGGEYLYMVFDNGVVEQYDMEGNLVKLHTGCADRKVDAMVPYVDADGQVFLKASNQNRFYRLDGTDIPGEKVLFRVGTAETGAQFAASALRWPFSMHGSCYVDDQVQLSEPDSNFNQNTEAIYSMYHVDGTMLSNFRFTVLYSTERSSSTLPHGINYTYFATISIDDTVFEHVLDGRIIAGASGSLYLVLYLENEVELYRITPGHTDGPGFGVPKEQAVDQSAEELMVPVGTKTTVEKVTSYPIGEGEALQYVFEWEGPVEPEDAFLPTLPYTVQIDENEDVYFAYWWPIVTRLRDGKQWKSTRSWKTSYPESDVFHGFVISDGYLYMVFGEGVVEQYDMEGNLVKVHTGCADRKIDAMSLCLDADGQPYLEAWSGNGFYNLDGTDIPGERAPFRVGTAEMDTQFAASAPNCMFSKHGSCYVDTQYKASKVDVNWNNSWEAIYSVYHADSTLLSNFHYTELRSTEKSPCLLMHEFNYTYFATVSIDDIVFENVLYGDIVAGENGSLYLMLYFENRVELYRITTGHTDGLKLGALKEQTVDQSADGAGADSSAQMQRAAGGTASRAECRHPCTLKPYHYGRPCNGDRSRAADD